MSVDIIKFELLNENVLSILWSDSHLSYILTKDLRNSCPCATCRTAKKGFKKSLPILPSESYNIINSERVGKYALQFKWEDGHRTGIFSYVLLKKLCTCIECQN